MNIKTLISLLAVSAMLVGCDDGDDGSNGANGTDGTNGLTSLINQTALAVGNANCANGGVAIESGLDADGDGALGESEVSETEFVCNAPVSALSSAAISTNTFNAWFVDGEQQAQTNLRVATEDDMAPGAAKNVILFIGDGMGPSTVTGARIFEGQAQGLDGEEHLLSFEQFPYAGLAKTYNVDAQTPDSAGTMTAMMTGVKTDVGVIGVDEDIARSDCSTVAGNELVTALELAEIAGKSTGVISTARITHATPAATYAKSADRNWEDVSDMPAAAVTGGCLDIADQLINFESLLEGRISGVDVDGIDVVMGGGRRHFLPNDPAFNSPDAVSATEGDRTDGRDLTAEWLAAYPTGSYVFDQAGFDAINTTATSKVLGLFNESHMQYEGDRANDVAGEPSLSEMVTRAVQVLDNNPEGFFLMVESGRIDHAHHAGNAWGAFTDTVEFAKAVRAAVNQTSMEDTLIIVTADHSHVMTIGGYPKRGNPILGKVVSVGSTEPALASDDLPHTTVTYTNGRGFRNGGSETDSDTAYSDPAEAGRRDLTAVDTTQPGYHQETLVPLSSETHAGEDVGVYGAGPGSSLVRGTNEQNLIFHIMDRAADLANLANARQN